MRAAITKIQILTDKDHGLPLFYCHRDDRDHEPELALERSEDGKALALRAKQMLYKVKQNPQGKNRVDIYMSLVQARDLGSALRQVATCAKPEEWWISTAQPGARMTGNMKLPRIVWTRTSRCILAAARVRTGIEMSKRDGYVNVDLEFPDESHIKMKDYEVHVGIQLDPPKGGHDPGETVPVHVLEAELQKGRSERNPIHKVRGDFYLELSLARAAGLGDLLHAVEIPASLPAQTY